MKITIESTSKLVEIQSDVGASIPARIWEGMTDTGIPVHCYVTRICPSLLPPLSPAIEAEFKESLMECKPPSRILDGIPLKFFLD